ncbi:MAG: GuaB3 family IMP dehydrogenase-related protein [Actinobacteria bacterium]|nr:GuaB3 family IMP dehydrogenase-related protein [Actinomycetota bacterium]
MRRTQSNLEAEIGIGKSARYAYGFDDIAIVPSRRTRDPDDVDISWEIDAYRFELPLMAAAMDAVVSPTSAITIGNLGGLGVLNLEGLHSRYDDADAILQEIAELPASQATSRMQELYQQPIKEDLMARSIRRIKEGGVIAAGSLTPQRVEAYAKTVLEAELDVLVIQGTVVSAEHLSTQSEPLNLKQFIATFDLPVIVGGCASYQPALHLMRTGAIGVLVGVGPGAACTSRQVLGIGVPQATAIADAAAARMRHLDESGRYVQVIADGGMRTGGDIAKAIACGADGVMIGSPLARATDAPGRGFHWGMATFHSGLPRGVRIGATPLGTAKQILTGPTSLNDGTMNLMGALKTSMATTGYGTLKEFQKAEVVIAPSIKTEGKYAQRSQGIVDYT